MLLFVITSNLLKDDYSVTIDTDNLEAGIMPEQSVIKAHKLFTIDKSKIIKRFSIINQETFDQVKVKFLNLL